MTLLLCIDLFCGLGGWTEGFLAEGWRVVGFDIERHVYGDHRYPAPMVLQDVRTLHGSQFRHAEMIVASSPCQEFSYRAMPWKRAKALPPPYVGMELFAQAARIQREACEAAGRHIPMIQENVRGAQKSVGKARWHYGSYYLWGDVPALMPPTCRAVKVGTAHDFNMDWSNYGKPGYKEKGFNDEAIRMLKAADDGAIKAGQANVANGKLMQNWGRTSVRAEGVKQGGDWFNKASLDDGGQQSIPRRSGSKSSARKAASARIAMIPFPLAQYLARVYYPMERDGLVT